MPSIRETALLALYGKLRTLAVSGGPEVQRNESYPERIAPGGWINLADGDPGEPEVTMSPLTYSFQHMAMVLCAVQKVNSVDRDSRMDALLQGIVEALEDDRTLGGAVEHLEIQPPDTGTPPPVEGAEGIKIAEVPVILFYSSSKPI